MADARRKTRVLIIARETVIAALIGLLLELENYEPLFARPDERPDEAVSRLRPPLVVMLDGGLDAAGSDLFHARAATAGARVVLFSEPVAADAIQAVARGRSLPYVAMPADRAALSRAIEMAIAG